MSILLLIEYSLEVANGKGFCKDLDKDYFRIGGSWECSCGAGRDPSVLHCSLCLFHRRIWDSGSKAQGGVQAVFGFCFRPRLCWRSMWSPGRFLFQMQHPQSPSAPSGIACGFPGNPGCPSSPFSVDHSSLIIHTPDFLHVLGISRDTLEGSENSSMDRGDKSHPTLILWMCGLWDTATNTPPCHGAFPWIHSHGSIPMDPFPRSHSHGAIPM